MEIQQTVQFPADYRQKDGRGAHVFLFYFVQEAKDKVHWPRGTT